MSLPPGRSSLRFDTPPASNASGRSPYAVHSSQRKITQKQVQVSVRPQMKSRVSDNLTPIQQLCKTFLNHVDKQHRADLGLNVGAVEYEEIKRHARIEYDLIMNPRLSSEEEREPLPLVTPFKKTDPQKDLKRIVREVCEKTEAIVNKVFGHLIFVAGAKSAGDPLQEQRLSIFKAIQASKLVKSIQNIIAFVTEQWKDVSSIKSTQSIEKVKARWDRFRVFVEAMEVGVNLLLPKRMSSVFSEYELDPDRIDTECNTAFGEQYVEQVENNLNQLLDKENPSIRDQLESFFHRFFLRFQSAIIQNEQSFFSQLQEMLGHGFTIRGAPPSTFKIIFSRAMEPLEEEYQKNLFVLFLDRFKKFFYTFFEKIAEVCLDQTSIKEFVGSVIRDFYSHYLRWLLRAEKIIKTGSDLDLIRASEQLKNLSSSPPPDNSFHELIKQFSTFSANMQRKREIHYIANQIEDLLSGWNLQNEEFADLLLKLFPEVFANLNSTSSDFREFFINPLIKPNITKILAQLIHSQIDRIPCIVATFCVNYLQGLECISKDPQFQAPLIPPSFKEKVVEVYKVKIQEHITDTTVIEETLDDLDYSSRLEEEEFSEALELKELIEPKLYEYIDSEFMQALTYEYLSYIYDRWHEGLEIEDSTELEHVFNLISSVLSVSTIDQELFLEIFQKHKNSYKEAFIQYVWQSRNQEDKESWKDFLIKIARKEWFSSQKIPSQKLKDFLSAQQILFEKFYERVTSTYLIEKYSALVLAKSSSQIDKMLAAILPHFSRLLYRPIILRNIVFKLFDHVIGFLISSARTNKQSKEVAKPFSLSFLRSGALVDRPDTKTANGNGRGLVSKLFGGFTQGAPGALQNVPHDFINKVLEDYKYFVGENVTENVFQGAIVSIMSGPLLSRVTRRTALGYLQSFAYLREKDGVLELFLRILQKAGDLVYAKVTKLEDES